MIIDTRADVNKSFSVRDAMAHSDIAFYLTGSQFFGNSRANSDWDYFTEDNYNTKQFLENLGFVVDSVSYNNDTSVVLVMYHRGENIHVQFVKDVWVKSFAQEVLHSCVSGEQWSKMSKANKNTHWHIAMAAGRMAKP